MIDNYMLYYKNLPKLDLHGENRYSAKVLVEEFLNDNKKLGNNLVIVIHGQGLGILKKSLYDYLKKNKMVKNYRLNFNNPGETIIEL